MWQQNETIILNYTGYNPTSHFKNIFIVQYSLVIMIWEHCNDWVYSFFDQLQGANKRVYRRIHDAWTTKRFFVDARR